MSRIHTLLQKLGLWGMAVSYLLVIVFIALLYLGVVAGDLLGQLERTTIAIGLFLVITYTYARHFYASGKLDESLFYTHPITTLANVKCNVQSQGVESFYLGNASTMKRTPDWETLGEQYSYAKHSETAHDPALDQQRRSAKWFGRETILGVKYKDGLAQFVQIEPVSNDLFEAIECIKPFVGKGTPVYGEFEALKNAQPQFTTKRWTILIAIIFVITALFLLGSVLIVGWQDSVG